MSAIRSSLPRWLTFLLATALVYMLTVSLLFVAGGRVQWQLLDAACTQHVLKLRHEGKCQLPELLASIGKDLRRAAGTERAAGQLSGHSGLWSWAPHYQCMNFSKYLT